MTPSPRPFRAPFTHGETLSRVELGDFVITRAIHAPSQRLALHAHEYANLLLVLRGAFAESVAGRNYECGRDGFLVRPAAEPHANVYGTGGAECLIVGVRPRRIAAEPAVGDALGEPLFARAGRTSLLARQLERELRTGDAAARLAMEGLVLELLAAVARRAPVVRERAVPAWLRRAQERIHASLGDAISLEEIAREAGVHPVHLGRTFRRFLGSSPGEYLRKLRIERACVQLSGTREAISRIALEAGFSSPSHFATAFRREVGLTPREYRASASRGLARESRAHRVKAGFPRPV